MNETTAQRDSLFDSYVRMQTSYLSRETGRPAEELEPYVRSVVEKRYQPLRIVEIRSAGYGNTKLMTRDLWAFLNETRKGIITPSGSLYKPASVCQSIFSRMVIDKLAERKKVKKLQLKAAGAGDTVLAKRCWYKQATIKINCNSLPGGFGSSYNIMYDKGGYNSITSSARCMISRAYTICEQLLGGNFAWFSLDELINFITLNLNKAPSDQDIEACLKRYSMRTVGKDELLAFYTETLHQYVFHQDMSAIDDLLGRLTIWQTSFLYYYCNLRHIIWGNEEVFRKYIDYLFNVDGIEVDMTATRDDAFSFDDTVVALTTVAFTDKLGSYGQVDICNDHPEYIPKLVTYCRTIENRLKSLDMLMATFVNTDADIPLSIRKPMTWRNTTIVSDTDSVIFSMDAWDEWYRNGEAGVDARSYQIGSLVIYWLHHAVKFALRRFSIAFGVDKSELGRLAMKNEFLISPMMIFDIKKTYAGLQKVQEGVIFKDPKPDIKGATLRGSTLCAEALDFMESFIVDDILKPSLAGRISGSNLISKVVGFERHIADSLEHQDLTFLKVTSLKYERDYKTPETTSVVVAWRFWEEVMSETYGNIQPPTKVKIFAALQPDAAYLQWLESVSPKIHAKLISYLTHHSRFPNQLIINPTERELPKEFVPLVNRREVIWSCIQPVYNTMKRLNISLGCEKQKLLFSDIW